MEPAPAPTRFASHPRIWVFSTYFTEGFPYMVVRTMSSVFFTDIGMSERFLGYLNFWGCPGTSSSCGRRRSISSAISAPG
jgi:hypothetical protein